MRYKQTHRGTRPSTKLKASQETPAIYLTRHRQITKSSFLFTLVALEALETICKVNGRAECDDSVYCSLPFSVRQGITNIPMAI